MGPQAIEHILSCETLPSLPATAVRVLEISKDPDCSVNELAEVIRFDQGLAAKILRTVNSSLYGLRTKCSTIDKALVVLGLRELRNLALGFSLVPAVQSAANDAFDAVDYWRRGIYSAVGAKIAAGDVAKQVADEAFLGGLLQDIGVMAMLQALGKPYAEVLSAAGGDHRKLAALELRTFDMQHPEVGALLARKWQLPDELVVPVRFHERPTAAPPELADVVRCVALGNHAHRCLTYEDKADCLRRFYDQGRRFYGLDTAACESILERTARAAREVGRLFEVDTGEGVDPDALLAQARALLDQQPSNGQEEYHDRGAASAVVRDGNLVDPITGAMTRLAIERELESAFERSRPERTPLCLALVRLDGYTKLIERAGLEAGDVAAIDAIDSLTEACAPLRDARVGRFDDATIAIVTTSPLPVLTSVLTAWRTGFRGDDHPTTSVGVTACADAGYELFDKAKQVMAIAYKALRAAEGAGGDTIRSFVPGKDKRAA